MEICPAACKIFWRFNKIIGRFSTILVKFIRERENFLRVLDGNEESLSMLSMDRLIELEKYYNTIIEQNAQKIRELKTTA